MEMKQQGDKIRNDGSNQPKNWYDYGKSKWANIVVKGKKTDGTETATYFHMDTTLPI